MRAHGRVEVVAAVINEDGRYLACRRNADRSAGGLWEFPGGKVEAGETREAALVREIDEELSARIEVGDVLVEVQLPGSAIRLVCMSARLLGPAPLTSTDHSELRWVSTEDLGALDWAPADWPAVDLLRLR